MSGPISFLVEHEIAVLTAYQENNGKPGNTWNRLETELPELSQAMTFNTFKQYVTVFAYVKSRLDELRQIKAERELAALITDKLELQQKLEDALERLDKVTQDSSETVAKLEETVKQKDRLEALLNKDCGGLDKVIKNTDQLPRKTSGRLDKAIQNGIGSAIKGKDAIEADYQFEDLQNGDGGGLDKVRQNTDRLPRKTSGRLDKVIQNGAGSVIKDKDAIEGDYQFKVLQNGDGGELDKVRQARLPEAPVRQKSTAIPGRISGWSVQQSKDGYYRCYRKINKRVHSVYLGKQLDVKDAEHRIKAKEKSLGLR